MPGPLDPRTDNVTRAIILDHLRRDLMYFKFDQLELHYLEPLRTEVTMELARLRNDETKAHIPG